MSRVADILRAKGGEVQTIAHDAKVFEAIRQMVESNVGSVIVMQGNSIRGIFTERDYLRRIALEGRTSRETPVQDVMTAEVICVDPGRSVEDCMAVMTKVRIRHLPVMEDGKLAGIVSIGDVVKFLSQEREAEIRYLTEYISGKYPA